MEFLQQIDIYSFTGISLLIIAGFMVGFINTIAGSGTVITYSLFMLFGLPVTHANGTIRLGVIMQTLAATLNFKRQNVLDLKKGIKLGIPVVLGSVVGAQIAVSINKEAFKIALGVVMLLMVFFIFRNPQKWLKGQTEKIQAKPTAFQYLVFFLTGMYGGFIHIGVGIFLLTALVLNAGYDVVKANAIKVMVVFLYSPFALAVFMINDQVHYGMGLISAIGNIFGGLVASRFAVSWGAGFVRWFLLGVMIVFTTYLFGFL